MYDTMQLVELTVDGTVLRAEPGATILSVARGEGIYIPTLCYVDGLEAFGGCRLCVVEVEGHRTPMTACTTPVEPGMVIRTHTPELERLRRITLELILADHPGECLSCGKNLECRLQEVARQLGVEDIRFRRTEKNLPIDDSNPFFIRDPNKCILCGACVRVCHARQGVGAVDFKGRGYTAVVGAARDASLEQSPCESCGECVLRCPTGAISNRERRPALKTVRSVCTYCGNGCGVLLGVRGREIVSVDGDPASLANRGSLCVKGRYGFPFVNSDRRIKTPLIRRGGREAPFEEASWDEALDLVARRFASYSGQELAVVASARSSNEDCYVTQKFARAVLRTNNVDNCARLCHAPTVAGLAKAFGTGGGTNPLEDIEQTRCIFVIGSNPTEAHPVAGNMIRRAAKHAALIVADPREIELAKIADIWMQQHPGTDVALLMGMARVIVEEGLEDREFIAERTEGFEPFRQSLEAFDLETVERITGVPGEQIAQAARMYASHKPGLILYSLGITEHSHGVDNVLALANLALLTGNVGKVAGGVMPMRGQNNVQGACDMGCVPPNFPGYQPVANPEVRAKHEAAWGGPLPETPGLTLVEQLQAALEGRVKAFYIVGMDVAYSVSDTNRVHQALRTAEFVVAQDIFLTGTAEFADVVLPAASFAEKDGTFTNLERRVQRVRAAIPPVGESRPDWWITSQIARRMGAEGFDYSDASQIMDEIASLTPAFAGFSFERLDREQMQWPCYGPDQPPTPRLHVESFRTPSGKGVFAPLEYRPPVESADEQYPFVLTTGRALYHFHLAMTSNVPGLMALHPEETVSINPVDAERLGIADGELVRVSSRRGSLVVSASVTDAMRPGEAFMTFHFYNAPTNVLTHQVLDPVSKTPEFKVTAVRIDKLDAEEAAAEAPQAAPAASS